ncbi:MAG: hypothetical protein ACOYK8_02335 [Alphaproteobacteria bacterium]
MNWPIFGSFSVGFIVAIATYLTHNKVTGFWLAFSCGSSVFMLGMLWIFWKQRREIESLRWQLDDVVNNHERQYDYLEQIVETLASNIRQLQQPVTITPIAKSAETLPTVKENHIKLKDAYTPPPSMHDGREGLWLLPIFAVGKLISATHKPSYHCLSDKSGNPCFLKDPAHISRALFNASKKSDHLILPLNAAVTSLISFWEALARFSSQMQKTAPVIFLGFRASDFCQFSPQDANMLDGTMALGYRLALFLDRLQPLPPDILRACGVQLLILSLEDMLAFEQAEWMSYVGSLALMNIELWIYGLEEQPALRSLLDYRITYGSGDLLALPIALEEAP